MRTRRGINVLALALGLGALGCGGGGSSAPLPADPETTVHGFLSAVRTNDLADMAGLWGSADRGPSTRFMSADQRQQRLSVIRAYLVHERYDILGSNTMAGGDQGARVVRVRLLRQGCMPVVPFTVVPWGTGWLVTDIDLASAGNPRARCSTPDGTGATQ